MKQTRIKIAKPDIISLFQENARRVFRYREIGKILEQNRNFWRLSQSTGTKEFIDFLSQEGKLGKVELNFPARKETFYTWGDVPIYEVVQCIDSKCYLSHYTAISIHELTEQIPKTIYVNREQSPKPQSRMALAQETIDRAFRRQPRVSSAVASFREYSLVLLSGKHTNQLGVVNKGTEEHPVRVTSIERTLIDIVVRPFYAGGIHEVLKVFSAASGQVSINKLAAILKTLNFVYPYHQAIGFYMEKCGKYTQSQMRLLKKSPFDYDFYLTYGMADMEYSPEWRLYFPKGF